MNKVVDLRARELFWERLKGAAAILRSKSYVLVLDNKLHCMVHPEDSEEMAMNLEKFCFDLNRTVIEYNQSKKIL